jgi:hypothetical protein
MKNTVRALFLLLVSGGLLLAQIAKNRSAPTYPPGGIWESPSGVRYNIRLSGDELLIQLAGTHPTFLQYEVKLKHNKDAADAGDPNRYEGTGFFRAKLKSGKECRFDTKWEIAVVAPKTILGSAPDYQDPDPETCKPKNVEQKRIELTKK